MGEKKKRTWKLKQIELKNSSALATEIFGTGVRDHGLSEHWNGVSLCVVRRIKLEQFTIVVGSAGRRDLPHLQPLSSALSTSTHHI